MKPEIKEAVGDDDFFHTAGLGLIRACVKNKDGTSHLMLQGMSRVKFDGFLQTTPFRIAKLVPIPPIVGTEAQIAPLVAEVRALCKRFRAQGLSENIETFLFKMKDPDMLADAVAHSFVQDPLRRQQILEEPRLAERLELIIRHIDTEMPTKKGK
jgi:ATP-dependent Lon protease